MRLITITHSCKPIVAELPKNFFRVRAELETRCNMCCKDAKFYNPLSYRFNPFVIVTMNVDSLELVHKIIFVLLSVLIYCYLSALRIH